MAVQFISTVDLSDRFDIPGSDATWVLPWNVTITSLGTGIQEYFSLAGNRIVVNGHVASEDYGIYSESADADLRVGKTGAIEAEYGLYCGAITGDANFANAGRIAGFVGIGVETARATIRNTGVIECDFGIYSFLSGVYRESIDIFNSGSISGFVGISAMGWVVSIELTETSRIIASSTGITLLSGAGRTTTVDNAGLIRAITAIEGSGGADTLINSGFIVGDVTFGPDADTFRSAGGKVHGDISGEVGDDRYFIDDSSTRIIEMAGQGSDRVFTSVSYELVSDGIDYLKLTGQEDIDAAGAGGDETITGNAGRNRIEGMDGADTLAGGKGRDTLSGGEGEDTFVFRTGWARDTITDFLASEDRIDLSGLEAVKGYRDLTRNHMVETPDGVLITAGDDWLAITGASLIDLAKDMFDL